MAHVEQLAFHLGAAAAPRTIADDPTGRIAYVPGVLGPDAAARLFRELREGVEWRHERRPMYDRVVDVPRLVAHFGPADELPPALAAVKPQVETIAGDAFNSVGLNLYRDGRDSVAMHNDHRDELEPLSTIALLSLGATRAMRLHTKERPRRSVLIALEPGSMLLMAGAAQEHWEHGIPKTREPVGERISVAFRRRPVE